VFGLRSRAALLVALTMALPLGAPVRAGESAVKVGAGSRAGDPWAGWEFVMGEWIGEGTGTPGEGSGGFTFAMELDGRSLVRRSHADYPPAGGKPATHHQDLMLFYREPGEADASALYLDNEGHVIHYRARAAARGDTLTLRSRPAIGMPAYRFTYVKAGERALRFTFEIAPPARPDSFSTYITGLARKKVGRWRRG
jgi:hypothetical protein